MKALEWFRFRNAASDPTVAEIQIIDVIGDWLDEMINEYWGVKATVTAKAFVDELAKLPEAVTTIRVRINSPGGDVFAALNIANALRDQQLSKGRTVETYVDGLAASAASIIAMAGSRVVIADNALFMIHNPWSVAMGEAADMRKAADTLDTVRNTIVATYQWHSTMDAKAIEKAMDAETWLDADEAIEFGFATEKVEGLQAAASISAKALDRLHVPEQFKDRVRAFLKPEPKAETHTCASCGKALSADAMVYGQVGLDGVFCTDACLEAANAKRQPVAASATEVLRACREGECLDQAEALIAAGATLEQVQAKVAETAQARARAAERTKTIGALCAAAKLPELADSYARGGMTVEDIRAQLTTITARLDATVIDTKLDPTATGSTAPSQLNARAIYEARKRGGNNGHKE